MIVVHMIGNAHIDPVWLWNWPAGVDEALATFRSAADRCDEYPQFIFTRGEAWLYDQVQQTDPQLFERVTQHVKRGQWHITGGQWLQPDVNLPTWAGLRRQIIHGRRYFQQHFGVKPTVGYNVDSFGHPATLPDLLAGEGYEGYVFHRPNQKQTALPASTFIWRGVNGGEVIGYRIPKPYVTRTHDLYGQIMLAADAADARLGHVMCFYGVGNHGGGPTQRNIEYILEHQNAFNGLELRFSTPQLFFEACNRRREVLPTVEFELQRTFPGCYSVMGDIKREQHRGEHRLEHTADVINAFAPPADHAALHAKLDQAWQDLLFTQFHDILAGTSIPDAWPSVRGYQGRARVAAEEIVTLVSRRHAIASLPKVEHQQIAVLNANAEPFTGLVQHEPFLDFDEWGQRWISDDQGKPVDVQFVQPASTIMLTPAVLLPVEVPARQARIYLVRSDARPKPLEPATDLESSSAGLRNQHVSVSVSDGGIRLVECDGKVIARDLTLQLRKDSSDTWGFHIDRFEEPVHQKMGSLIWTVEETGPLRARLRGEGSIGNSRLRWTLTLHRGEPALRMTLEVLFCEQHTLLQMPLHCGDGVARWRAALAGGAVDRDVSPVEWPMHGWTALGETAMLTPDAYSASFDGSSLTWTLLRSPRMAWSGQDVAIYNGRNDHTDQGQHQFEFILTPRHEDGSLNALSRTMTRPLIIFDRYDGMGRPPWGDNPPRRMWTGAEQRARADGRMPHLQDAGGASVEEPGTAELTNPTT